MTQKLIDFLIFYAAAFFFLYLLGYVNVAADRLVFVADFVPFGNYILNTVKI